MICNNCDNYRMSRNQTHTFCSVKFDIPFFKLNEFKEYFNKRENKEKNFCKYFKKLNKKI